MVDRVFYSDYDGFFTKQSDGDVQRDTDVQAILNSLSNILLTIQGERRMLPTFASNITYLLFEPIAENIIDAIKVWEDRIDVTGFDIEPLYDQNSYRCRINFTVVGSNEVQTVNFILTR